MVPGMVLSANQMNESLQAKCSFVLSYSLVHSTPLAGSTLLERGYSMVMEDSLELL